MRRLGRIYLPTPSRSTILIAGITVTAGALTALALVVSAGSGYRQPFQAAADSARGLSVTAPAGHPSAPAVSPVPIGARQEVIIERRLAAERRAKARAAAKRRAEQAAQAQQATAPAVPAAPAAPAVPSSAGSYSFAALESLWVSAGGPSWAASQAASIAICESGGNPRAYNPSGASGLWQILGQVVPGDLFDPMVNAENAVSKFRASGDTFAQWVC